VYRVAGNYYGEGKASKGKLFFFEKKNQKTFFNLVPGIRGGGGWRKLQVWPCAGDLAAPLAQSHQKLFASFFQKRSACLA
jgi:hypothetical protein